MKTLTNEITKWNDFNTKLYNTMYGVGKAKYIINTHDGVQLHKDGSKFFGIKTFSNKEKFEQAQKDLIKQGYSYEYN